MSVPRIPMPAIRLRKHTPDEITQRVRDSRDAQRQRLDDTVGKRKAPAMPQPRPGESISLPSGRRVPRR